MEAKNELQSLQEKFLKDLNNFKNTKIKCGIIGRSGTGKSSLINAIVGEEIAEVGEVETTMTLGDPIEHKGLNFYDLPGCSTTNFPKEGYIDQFQIQNFDCVILVTADRFYEDDLFLIEELNKIKVPVYAVRTKTDFSVDRGLRRNISEEETLITIFNNLKENLKGYRPRGIYLTSSDFPQEYDLGRLLDDIYSGLGKLKQERFIADINITSEKILLQKKEIAKKMVSRYALLAAANGVNPIPGLDISVDAGLLLKMGHDIQSIYGLNEEQQSFNMEFLGKKKAAIIASKALQFSAKYIGREALMLLLKKAGAVIATKTAAKWIPFVGQAISATAGFLLTSSLGDGMIKDAEEIATETFNAFKNIRIREEV